MSRYDFRTLSPLDFEELVRDLLQAELSILVESFKSGRDSGVDLRFAAGAGNVIVQVKHYVDSSISTLLAATRREDSKVALLRPARYIFVTSLGLTPVRKGEIKLALPSAPLASVDILGREDINNLLERHPKIEKQHFKLWLASVAVLERILHRGTYQRTESELDAIRVLVPKYVQNLSVEQSHKILDKHGSLIIAGHPGVGKSTLARILLWMHASEGWTVSIVDDIADVFSAMHEGDKNLVFFDDFLGQVRLTTDGLRTVDQKLPAVVARTRSSKNFRFVMTTRDYILRQAQNESDRLNAPELQVTEFSLDVGVYTRSVKARILFNHIYFSQLTSGQRHELIRDDFFLKIIDHKNFNPRLIQVLTSPDYYSIVDMAPQTAAKEILDRPDILWERPYRAHISSFAQTLLVAIVLFEDRVPFDDLVSAFAEISIALGRPIPAGDVASSFRRALRELEGSMIAIEQRSARFANPGLRDFMLRVLREDSLVPLLLPYLHRIEQVSNAWKVWEANDYSKQKQLSVGAEWTAALRRTLTSDTNRSIDCLKFGLKLYAHWMHQENEVVIFQALSKMRAEGLDESEIRDALISLEEIALIGLDTDLEVAARKQLSNAVVEALPKYSFSMATDDFCRAIESIREYGVLDEQTECAIKELVREYLGDIRSILDSVESIYELDEARSQLGKLVAPYSMNLSAIDLHFDAKRERLEEEDDRVRPTSPSSVPKIWAEPTSDDEVRSIFSSLLDAEALSTTTAETNI